MGSFKNPNYDRFRWVTYQIDYLCEQNNDRDLRNVLESLPPTLPQTYERILARVNASSIYNQRMVQRALKWIRFATVRITLATLAEAISIDVGDRSFKAEALVHESSILNWCSSLIRISKYGSPTTERGYVVEFAHFTVEEFLTAIDPEEPNVYQAYSIRRNETVHLELGRICLTYLCLDDFSTSYSKNSIDYATINKQYPFRIYAAVHWMHHLRGGLNDETVLDLSRKLFEPSKSNNFLNWAQVFLIEHKRVWKASNILEKEEADELCKAKCLADTSTLHWASLLSIRHLCEYLLGKGADVNKHSSLGSPLHCALAKLGAFDHDIDLSKYLEWDYPKKEGLDIVQAVNLLIQAGANPNTKRVFPRTERSSMHIEITPLEMVIFYFLETDVIVDLISSLLRSGATLSEQFKSLMNKILA